jgi:hypothetical protein
VIANPRKSLLTLSGTCGPRHSAEAATAKKRAVNLYTEWRAAGSDVISVRRLTSMQHWMQIR